MCVSSVFVLLYDVLCASSSPPPLSSPPWGTSGFPQGTRFNAHGVQEVHCVQSSHIRPCLFSHFTADWFFPFVRPPPPTHPPPFPRFLVSKGETQLLALVDKLKGEGLDHHLWIEQPEGIATTPSTTPTSPPAPPPITPPQSPLPYFPSAPHLLPLYPPLYSPPSTTGRYSDLCGAQAVPEGSGGAGAQKVPALQMRIVQSIVICQM